MQKTTRKLPDNKKGAKIKALYGVATNGRLLRIRGLFCRNTLFYGALLQKRPIILRSLLIVAIPYEHARDLSSDDGYDGYEDDGYEDDELNVTDTHEMHRRI